MASVKICDGRTVVYQYDTGVSIELCDCRDFTECHFAVNDGIIRRDVEDNICSVPDAALVNAGTLTVYAFSRNDDGGQTQHTFFIHVMARPKPADYIDPPDEMDNIDQIVERTAAALSLFVVHVKSADGVYHADKTAADIDRACNAGRACIMTIGDTVYTYAGRKTMQSDGKYHPCFITAIEKDLKQYRYRAAYVMDDGSVSLEVVGQISAPSPYGLVFQGAVNAVYNGSKAVTVTIPEGGSGGTSAPEIMKVTFTSPNGGDNIEPDKTFTGMTEALAAGKLLYAEIDIGIDFFDGQFSLYQATDDAIMFTRLGAFPGDTPMVAIMMVGVASDDSVISDFVPISGGGGSGAMFVAFTTEDGENWKANKPFDEVYEAYMDGQMVYAHMNGTIVPALNIDSAAMHFILQMYVDGMFATAEIIWSSDNSVTYTEDISPIGGGSGGGNVVAVTITYDDKTPKASHTSSEIYNLVRAGNGVLLQFGAITCTAIQINEDECVFHHMPYLAETGGMVSGDYLTVAIAGDVVTIKDYLSKRSYPNPHPLVINGVSYDGSERVEIEEGVYELIETITIEEATSAVNITKDSAGKSFELNAATVKISKPANATAYILQCYTYHTNFYSNQMRIVLDFNSSGAMGARFEVYEHYGYYTGTGYMPSTAYSNSGHAIAVANNNLASIPFSAKICRLYFLAYGNNTIPAGSTIEIWGVRA